MIDGTKLAKGRMLVEDTDAENGQNCNTTGHEEENCYFGAGMETSPLEWNLTEAQKKFGETYEQAREPGKLKTERSQRSSSKDIN